MGRHPTHPQSVLVLGARDPRPIPPESPATSHVALREPRLWLDRLRRHHVELVRRFLSIDDVGLLTIDLFLVGVAQRSYHLVDGILAAFDDWNVTAAAPMVRTQIDSLVRVAYFASAPNSDVVAMDVIRGVEFRDMRAPDGKEARGLAPPRTRRASALVVRPVYEATSGWVHLSPAHVHTAWQISDTDDGTARLIGAFPMRPEHIPLSGLEELIDAMIQATIELFGLLRGVGIPQGPAPGPRPRPRRGLIRQRALLACPTISAARLVGVSAGSAAHRTRFPTRD